MFITGHVAAALLASRRWVLDPRIAVAATLFPDLIDKPAKLLGLVPYGRMPSHSLLVLGLTTAAVLLADRHFRHRGRWSAAWVVGFVAHLVLDFADVVPLLWPFQAYSAPRYPIMGARAEVTPVVILSGVLEMVLVLAAIYVEIRRRRRRRAALAAADAQPAGE